MNTVYIVIGETGEYADKRTWNVCAYADQGLAGKHAEKATQHADRVQLARVRSPGNTVKPDAAALAWDASMEIDYTGTAYSVHSCTLRTALPGNCD